MKTIKYYRKVQYGNEREFVHEDNVNDAVAIAKLTMRTTITKEVRELLTSLAGIQWQEVVAP